MIGEVVWIRRRRHHVSSSFVFMKWSGALVLSDDAVSSPSLPQKKEISLSADETGGTVNQGSNTVEFTTCSYDLELVVGVSRSSRLVGTYAFERAEAGSGPAFAYVELRDAADEQRTLLNRRFLRTVTRMQTLDLDLAPWTGEVVRLRVGVTGSGNGIVRWRDLRVSAVPREHLTSSEPDLP